MRWEGLGGMGSGEEKKFKFNWRNTVDGEPDQQTRVDWVKQMGTPYPHKHVLRLFEEARAKHEKRKAATSEGDDELAQRTQTRKKKRKKKKREGVVPVVAALTITESDEEREAPAVEKAVASVDGSSSDSEGEATGSLPPPKALVQPRIDAMFHPPVHTSTHSTLLGD